MSCRDNGWIGTVWEYFIGSLLEGYPLVGWVHYILCSAAGMSIKLSFSVI